MNTSVLTPEVNHVTLTDCVILNEFSIVQKSNYSSVSPQSLSNISDTLDVRNISNHNENTNLNSTSISNDDTDAYTILKDLKSRNTNRIIFSHLNINSIRNKFDMLSDLVANKVDVLLISETKLDDSFPTGMFLIPGFSKPYRLDRTSNGGGLLLFVRADLPSKLLTAMPVPENCEHFFIELNFRNKKKWLIGNIYIPQKGQIADNLFSLSKCLDYYYRIFDNVLLLGDFNAEVTESKMCEFCELYNLKNLVKEPTCFKNLENPSSIDLILTNRHRSFQHTIVIETGLSDFHKMTATTLKTTFKKSPPKIISYRNFRKFSNDVFRKELISMLSHYDINNIRYEDFDDIVMLLINKHAPLKFKYIRANEGTFMSKELRKAIMVRSKLKNRFNRTHSDETHKAYKLQRNTCTS